MYQESLPYFWPVMGGLVIVKGKSWATKNVDPNGLKVSFKIIGGCQFQATGEWDWEK